MLMTALAVIMLAFVMLCLGAGLGALAERNTKPAEHFIRVYSSDDPPPPDGELVWYYNPGLIPAWRHALYLDGRWLEYSGGLLDESPKLPPHQGWMPDPFPAAN